MLRRTAKPFANIDELYAAVRALIDDLRAAGDADAADRLTAAMTGGATSGEILGELRNELRVLLPRGPSEGAFARRINELLRALDDALEPRWL